MTHEPQGRVAGADQEELLRLANGLVEQAGAVRRHYEQLSQTLDEAGALAPAPDSNGGMAHAADEAPAGARMVALDMASAGESRETTKQYLRESFGVRDSDSIVDEVYDLAEHREPLPQKPKKRFARRGR